MPKATRKNTTLAKRATPDPIIKLIEAADEALNAYRNAELAVKDAIARRDAAYGELAKLTKEVALSLPTTASGALALVGYAARRTATSVQSINCVNNHANIDQLLWRALDALDAA